MKRHPFGGPLFLSAGLVDVDQTDIAESAALQPSDQGVAAGQEPDIAHSGVPALGDQHAARSAVNDQGFQDQFSAPLE